jgi:hypothetical protein
MRRITKDQGGSGKTPTRAGNPARLKEEFSIPPSIRNLNVAQLPMPVRLGHVLERIGAKKLGDLHGLNVGKLLRVRNCGKITLVHLRGLIERAASGEFEPSQKPFSPADAPAIVAWFDRVLDTLDPRDRRIFVARFGAKQWGKPTLESAGSKYGLTRERVRQIEVEVTSAIRQQGGPWGASRLQALQRFCREEKRVITPELFGAWLKGGGSPKHPIVMYVRVLGRLEPKLPVHPRAETAQERSDRLAGKAPPT